jgi:DNA repair protein SbcD/Mre11
MTSNSAITQTPLNAKTGFRVLHTADWHLGKMLGEHSREEEHRRFLSFLLDTIREHSVDLLIIAGDVFDAANPAQSAAAQYYNFLSALFRQGGCSVVIVAGNHDSPAHLEAPRQILKALGAHVVGALPESPSGALVPLPNADSPCLVVTAVPFLRDRDLRTGQSGQSAAEIQRALVEGIKRRYDEVAAAAKPWTDRGVPLLATGHLTVVGSRVSDSEREIHVGGLGAVSPTSFSDAFAYVALGHLHRPQAAGSRETVRYAGSPIPLSFSEAQDRKELRLLDFAEGKLLAQAPLEIPVFRPLAQITATRDSLEELVTNYQPQAADLTAWVEVVVEDPVPGENLYERAQGIVQGRPFEIIRVIGKRTAMLSEIPDTSTEGADRVTDLLSEPAKVFDHRLAAEPNLTDAERESLKTVFQELLNLHAEQRCVVDASAGGAISGAKP